MQKTPLSYLQARHDAGLLREYMAQRYGKLLVYGGSGEEWLRCRRMAGRLARMVGATTEEVLAQTKDDFQLAE